MLEHMKKRFLTLVSALLLASCAGPIPFTVTSSPSGAEVTINGKPRGRTPVTIPEMEQGKELVVVGYKPGYQSQTVKVPVERGFWSTVMWTEDDPRAWYLTKNRVHLNLTPLSSAPDGKRGTLPPLEAGTVRPQKTPVSEIPALRPMPQF